MEISVKTIGVRTIIPLVLFLCTSAWSVTNAYAEHRRACAEEIEKYCKDVKPCEGRLVNCLQEHKNKLSDECRGKIEEVGKRLENTQKECSEDIKKFCKGVQPGKGRILDCLRGHADELSPACRGKIECTKEEIEMKQKR